jgi:ribonuclease J
VTVGPFTIEFIRVTHSMPDCVALAITTPVGLIVHTGDFKIDQTPLDGEHFDLHRFAELGAQGVLALFADSTNIDRAASPARRSRSSSASRRSSPARTASWSSRRSRRASTACRCSSIWRRSSTARWRSSAAASSEREIAQRLGYLRDPRPASDPRFRCAELRVAGRVCASTGSQGEPQAALSRIAIDDHRFVKLGPTTRRVFRRARFPATRKAIARTMSHVTRRGADVITRR